MYNMLNITEYDSILIILCIWLTVWDLAWKAVGLYRAWQNSDYIRFIFIFIFNTCGILPIIYLIVDRNAKKEKHL